MHELMSFLLLMNQPLEKLLNYGKAWVNTYNRKEETLVENFNIDIKLMHIEKTQ